MSALNVSSLARAQHQVGETLEPGPRPDPLQVDGRIGQEDIVGVGHREPERDDAHVRGQEVDAAVLEAEAEERHIIERALRSLRRAGDRRHPELGGLGVDIGESG
jgi:hypothetical protein